MDVHFDHLRLFHLLWLMPALTAVYAYGFARKSRALRRFATANLFDQLMPQVSTARQKFKAALVAVAAGFLVVAAAGPRWGTYWEDVRRKGIDIVICLDVSRSMLAEDVAPNRLERAKQDIRDLLEQLPGDRIGLVTFAGTPVLTCPLTINYGSFRLALDEVDTDSAPRGGSLIGDAVRLAATSFVDRVKDHKAIIVITDGEDHESYPVEAARDAYEQQGIRLYTIGIGDVTQGQRIPVQQAGQRLYLTHEGQEVWSKMNPTVLQEMAVVGGGAYVPAGTAQIDLADIYQRLAAKVKRREFETTHKEMRYARFHWFAGVALLLLMIETLMSDRRAPATDATATIGPATAPR